LFWKRLWTCRKTDYRMNAWMNECMCHMSWSLHHPWFDHRNYLFPVYWKWILCIFTMNHPAPWSGSQFIACSTPICIYTYIYFFFFGSLYEIVISGIVILSFCEEVQCCHEMGLLMCVRIIDNQL
jgi:hypothetical protein